MRIHGAPWTKLTVAMNTLESHGLRSIDLYCTTDPSTSLHDKVTGLQLEFVSNSRGVAVPRLWFTRSNYVIGYKSRYTKNDKNTQDPDHGLHFNLKLQTWSSSWISCIDTGNGPALNIIFSEKIAKIMQTPTRLICNWSSQLIRMHKPYKSNCQYFNELTSNRRPVCEETIPRFRGVMASRTKKPSLREYTGCWCAWISCVFSWI